MYYEEKFFVPDPPPLSKKSVDQERCAICGSQALLVDGYCICGATLCRLCVGKHDCRRRKNDDRA